MDLATIESRLQEMRSFGDDWDDEGAEAIQRASIENALLAVRAIAKSDVRLPDLVYPHIPGRHVILEWFDDQRWTTIECRGIAFVICEMDKKTRAFLHDVVRSTDGLIEWFRWSSVAGKRSEEPLTQADVSEPGMFGGPP